MNPSPTPFALFPLSPDYLFAYSLFAALRSLRSLSPKISRFFWLLKKWYFIPLSLIFNLSSESLRQGFSFPLSQKLFSKACPAAFSRRACPAAFSRRACPAAFSRRTCLQIRELFRIVWVSLRKPPSTAAGTLPGAGRKNIGSFDQILKILFAGLRHLIKIKFNSVLHSGGKHVRIQNPG